MSIRSATPRRVIAPSSPPASPQSGSPLQAASELVVIWCCAELHLWMVFDGHLVWKAVNLAVLGLAIASSCWRRRSPLLALRPGPQLSAWGETLAVSAGLALALTLLAVACGLWTGGSLGQLNALDLAWWSLRKVLTVLGQQFLLHALVYPLFLECFTAAQDAPAASTHHRWLTARNLALGCSALAFAGLHLPNPLLTAFTCVAGAAWVWLFRRHRRILPLVVSHLALAMLARELCHDAVYHMRVGAEAWPLLPSAVSTAEGVLPLRPLSVQGALDRLQPAGDEMVCTGWAAYIRGGRPADAILVVYAGRTQRYRLTGHSRPDVAAAFGVPEIRHSGFELRLPRSWFDSDQPPRFFAELAPDRRAELWPAAR